MPDREYLEPPERIPLVLRLVLAPPGFGAAVLAGKVATDFARAPGVKPLGALLVCLLLAALCGWFVGLREVSTVLDRAGGVVRFEWVAWGRARTWEVPVADIHTVRISRHRARGSRWWRVDLVGAEKLLASLGGRGSREEALEEARRVGVALGRPVLDEAGRGIEAPDRPNA